MFTGKTIKNYTLRWHYLPCFIEGYAAFLERKKLKIIPVFHCTLPLISNNNFKCKLLEIMH